MMNHSFNLRNLRNLWIPLSVATVTLAAMWLYGRALGFAYFNDDPSGHFAWMEGRSLLQFFAGSADYGYYRPVVFTVLRLSELLFGSEKFPHNPAADHALLVLLHGANAAMVWLLARRLGGRGAYAWVAALVFAFVPFSYEAVAYVASLTHPLAVFWTLAALLLYDSGQDKTNDERRTTNDEFRKKDQGPGDRSRLGHSSMVIDNPESPATRHLPPATRFKLLALLAMTLGLLTHENGLFIFPALVGLDWVTRPAAGWRDRARRLRPFAVPPVLFAVLWLLIPKNSEQGLNGLADIGGNIVPFLQTLVYPLLPVARLDSSDTMSLVLLAVALVVVFGLLARRVGAARLWAFALGWVALSSLPALLFLSPAYVYGSPRLSYLPSVGVALLWAIPVLWLWAGRRSAVLSLLTAAYTLAIILPPLPFIRCQLDFYDETSRFARAMAVAGVEAPADRDLIFVNAPFFFSSTAARPEGCPSPYPWTPVGGVLVPPYAQARDFVRFNGGPDRAVAGVTYAGYGPGWRTFGPEIDGEALRNHAERDAVFIFDLLSGSFSDLSAGWQPGSGPADTPPLVTFGDTVALSGVRVQDEGDRLVAHLDWRVLGETEMPLAAFVHVYDAAGALVSQSDGPPGGGLVPQTLWRAGDGLADERALDLLSLPPGAYRIAVGVYNTADGLRLPAVSNGDQMVDDIFTIGVVER